MAIIIIKKHRNGGIFGEYRPAVLEFNALAFRCFAPSIFYSLSHTPPSTLLLLLLFLFLLVLLTAPWSLLVGRPGRYQSLFLLSPNLEADAC